MSTTPRPPLLSDDEIERYSMMYTIPSRYETARALKHAKGIYEAARAKDAEEIAKWKGIVKGVHGALTDIGTVPVPAMDADLYDAVMSIRAKDAALIQRLVDAISYSRKHGPPATLSNSHWDIVLHRALSDAAAAGFKPFEP